MRLPIPDRIRRSMSTACHRERSIYLQNEPWRALTLAAGWGLACVACGLAVAGFGAFLDIWPNTWTQTRLGLGYLLLNLALLLALMSALLMMVPALSSTTRIDQRGREEGYR